MNKARSQVKSVNKRQNAAVRVGRKRLVLLLSVLVPLAYVLGSLTTEAAKSAKIIVLLPAFFVLACGVLTIAVAQIVQLLKAIRSELIMIRARVDIECLNDIASDLTAMRDQMGKGVFGLLGM